MAEGPVILYDGDCGLCQRWVQFLLARAPAGRFRVAPLRSPAGRRLLAECGIEEPPESVVLLQDGRASLRSEAALRILRILGLPWSLAWPAIAIPRPVRDWLYDAVSRRRHRWSSRAARCAPSARERPRFPG